jgi:3-deoxy-D-arabino-heptulosonate 7-phosphate (DAHP) synthase class II
MQVLKVEFPGARRLPLAGYRGTMRYQVLNGGLMSSRDRLPEPGRVRLNEEDVAYVMNLLRNATQPVNTQQLIDVLRRHPGQFQTASGAGSDSTDESSSQ